MTPFRIVLSVLVMGAAGRGRVRAVRRHGGDDDGRVGRALVVSFIADPLVLTAAISPAMTIGLASLPAALLTRSPPAVT